MSCTSKLPSRLASSALLAAALGLGLALSASPAAAAATATTIGPDPLGAGRVVTQLDATGSPTPVLTLGDGSAAFSGLSFRPADGRFYAIGNDSFGNSSLVSFDASGPASLTSLGALGSGYRAMTYRAADDAFYAAATSPVGESTLVRITPAGGSSVIGTLGTAFLGGLTTGAAPGFLYGISADGRGWQRTVQQIDLATGATTPLFELGDGSIDFGGGLAWNDDDDRFEIIGSDLFGASALYTFDLGGAASLSFVGDIGFGYFNAGLTRAAATTPPPPPPPIPEPGTPALLLAALLGFLAGLPTVHFRRLRMQLARALRLPLLAALVLAGGVAQAQYSSPMRDVENPDRFLYQERGFFQINVNNYNNFMLFPTPAGKRYIIEFVSVTCFTPSAFDTFPQVLIGTQKTVGNSFVPQVMAAVQMQRGGSAPFSGYVWTGMGAVKVFSDPVLFEPTGGTGIFLNVFHTDTSVAVNCNGQIHGHSITL